MRPAARLVLVLLLVAALGWCFGVGFLGTRLSSVGPLLGLGHPPLDVSLEMGALIAGASIAIVEDLPGTTRDRIFAEVDMLGRQVTLVDTGGLEPQPQA